MNSFVERVTVRCIISTGLGRLHLVQSAEHLVEAGVDVELVQGWVPRQLPSFAIDFIGRLVGSKHLAAGMKKRLVPFLDQKKNHSCACSEVLQHGLNRISRFGMMDRGAAGKFAWWVFGRSTCKYLNDQDIFHVRSGAGRGGAIRKAKRNGLKIVTDHSIAHPSFIERALHEDYSRYNLRVMASAHDPFWASVLEDCKDCDLLLVNSDFVKDSFLEQGFSADSIAVVYLGVRDDFFSLKTDYIANQQLNLLFTGSFGIRKGAQYLLPALKQLNETCCRAQLTVVGASGEASGVIDAFEVGKSLKCTGFIPQDELKRYLAAADIYVFPSLAEGCASSGMEAMAAGLPVIATRESGLPIRHGENGWLIPSKSTDAIVAAVNLLGADQQLRERLGRNAAHTIAENYTWAHYAQKVSVIYTKLYRKDSKQ